MNCTSYKHQQKLPLGFTESPEPRPRQRNWFTRYGLDSLQIKSKWGGETFCTHPDQHRGPPSLLYNGYRVCPGGKAARAWHWPPTPSSAEVKKREQLYHCSPSGTSWPVLEWTLPLYWAAVTLNITQAHGLCILASKNISFLTLANYTQKMKTVLIECAFA